MTCDTIVISPDGVKSFKKKVAYNTLEDAIKEAKKQNLLETHTQKLVSYKCEYCCKFHIGRNGKPITEKDREKLLKEQKSKEQVRKVIGWIDLSKIRY